MIRVRADRPRVVRVPGVPAVVLEIHAGGLIRVREVGRRTWYSTSTGGILWGAARMAAEDARKQRLVERKARREARRVKL